MAALSNEKFIQELNQKYNQGNLVPFVGAGLSMPFHIPDWAGMIKECAEEFGISSVENGIFLPVINFDLSKYDYWSAIDNVKKYLNRTDEDIQEYVQNRILQVSANIDEKTDNNYIDLKRQKISLIFTTNYDHLISKFIKPELQAINLVDLNENIQNIMQQNGNVRIFHLHGNISQPCSIILSSSKYKELYQQDNYIKFMELFGGTKTFLFLGFSFNDVYIQQVIKENKKYFRAKHYIILANPTDEMIATLKKEYNIETIAYNPNDSSHVEEIRKILQSIFNETSEKHLLKQEEYEDLLPSKQEKADLENSLFCKKLRLEDIHETRIDASKEYFFLAEQYFRWLKRSGIKESERIADYILQQVYLKYKDEILEAIEEKSSPDELWKKVHKELKILELDKLKNKINIENMPNEYNKQGFVHVLADDKESAQEVWWGDKRFEN